MRLEANEADLLAIFADLDLTNIELPPDPLDELTEALGLREVTTHELALILCVTDRRLGQLWEAGIIPEPRRVKKRYYFPLLQSIRSYIEYLREG